MDQNNQPLTSLEFLKSFTSGDGARMSKYINMFLASTPADVEKMKSGAASGDWDSVRAAAHTLRPQTTYMGFKSGETLLREIEEKAKSATDTGNIPALVGQFGQMFYAACEELKENLKQIN